MLNTAARKLISVLAFVFALSITPASHSMSDHPFPDPVSDAISDALDALLGNAMIDDQDPLEQAILEQDPAKVQHALAQSLDTMSPEIREEFLARSLRTTLEAEHPDLEHAHYLVTAGAKPNAIVDPDTQTTLLMAAAARGSADAVQFLLGCGANPFLYNTKGLSALHLCAHAPDTPATVNTARFLIERIDNADYPTQNAGATLLFYVARQPDRCRLLALALDHHADPARRCNTCVSAGTPLDAVLSRYSTAEGCKRESTFKKTLLLWVYAARGRAGANVNAQNINDHFTPEQIVFMNQERERRLKDYAYINTLYSFPDQREKPFKESYNNALTHAVATSCAQAAILLPDLAQLTAEYAYYDPENDDYSNSSYLPTIPEGIEDQEDIEENGMPNYKVGQKRKAPGPETTPCTLQ